MCNVFIIDTHIAAKPSKALLTPFSFTAQSRSNVWLVMVWRISLNSDQLGFSTEEAVCSPRLPHNQYNDFVWSVIVFYKNSPKVLWSHKLYNNQHHKGTTSQTSYIEKPLNLNKITATLHQGFFCWFWISSFLPSTDYINLDDEFPP